MLKIPLLVPLFVSLAAFGEDGTSGAPEATIRSFYARLAKPQADLRRALKAVSPFLSPQLNKLVRRAWVADESFRKRFPNEAPPFEHGTCVFYGGGDCDFSSFKVLRAQRDGATIKCTMELALTDRNRPNEPSYRWLNTVILMKDHNQWVIVDTEVPGGRASESLKRIAKDAQEAIKN
jgi:hypothetical protein